MQIPWLKSCKTDYTEILFVVCSIIYPTFLSLMAIERIETHLHHK